MPSATHETLVTLFSNNPRIALFLLGKVLGVDMLAGASADIASAVFAQLNLPEYRADVVVRVTSDSGELRDMVIVEVQLAPDGDKAFSWPHYLTGARVRERCPVTLVVIAVDEQVARWCAQPIALDRAGSVVRPVVIGPDAIPFVDDEEYARRWPELAVLSAVAHRRAEGGEAVALAALGACNALDNDRGELYADLILANLGKAARRALEKLMEQRGYTYQSDFAKKYVAQGIAQGLEQGVEQGHELGLEEGLELGLEQGVKQGLEQGVKQGVKQGVISRSAARAVAAALWQIARRGGQQARASRCGDVEAVGPACAHRQDVRRRVYRRPVTGPLPPAERRPAVSFGSIKRSRFASAGMEAPREAPPGKY